MEGGHRFHIRLEDSDVGVIRFREVQGLSLPDAWPTDENDDE